MYSIHFICLFMRACVQNGVTGSYTNTVLRHQKKIKCGGGGGGGKEKRLRSNFHQSGSTVYHLLLSNREPLKLQGHRLVRLARIDARISSVAVHAYRTYKIQSLINNVQPLLFNKGRASTKARSKQLAIGPLVSPSLRSQLKDFLYALCLCDITARIVKRESPPSLKCGGGGSSPPAPPSPIPLSL